MIRKYLDYSLLPHNTFGIEARCKCFVDYDTEEDLQQAIAEYMNDGNRTDASGILHIGGGSNLLFVSDYDGTVFHSSIKGTEKVHEDGDSVILRAGAGVVWDEFVDYCVRNGYSGIENLSLIPGEVGASAIQNIGAYGVEAKDVIHNVEAIDLVTAEKKVFLPEECSYSYRNSIFKSGLKGRYAITHVSYRLSRKFVPNLNYGGLRDAVANMNVSAGSLTPEMLRNIIIDIRNRKLPEPSVLGNAGSFFMNPVVSVEKFERIKAEYDNMPYYVVDSSHVKIPAGWMIDQCGWKGKSLGPAGVYEKQALVLVNLGGATGNDILTLCRAVQADVKSKFDIDISPEVNFIGGER